MKRIFFILFLACTSYLFAQTDVSIIEYLKKIENGNRGEAAEELQKLKKKFPESPSLFYLEALLNEDGKAASDMYKVIAEKYPRSEYADAAVFRLYSFYSAINDHLSLKYADILRKNYASSPYTKIISPEMNKEIIEKESFNYTIQAGAFTNLENAENLKKKFQKDGYYALVQDKIVGGTVFKIVYAGRFNTAAETENFQQVLNKRYGIKGIISRLPE
jgi:hypothetical protein